VPFASRIPAQCLGCLLLFLVGPSHARAEAEEAPALVAQAQSDSDPDAAPDHASADEAEPADAAIAPPSDVEVIRIKGRGVSAIETDVPESVTQFDAAEIEALGAQNISDLAKVTPNVEIKTTGATAPTFFIRGVGLSDFSSNAAGAVAIYRDDVPINAPAIQLGTLFDLENVEVLRGPVATSSGRNASAGAIKVFSRRPTGELTAELRSSFGRFNLRDFEGAIESPLVDEVLSTRLAFRFTERDPYATNGCGGIDADLEARFPDPPGPRNRVGPSFCGEARNLLFRNPNPPPVNFRISTIPNGLPGEVNDIGDWAARGQLRFQPPGTEMDWLLNLHGERRDELSRLGQAVGTNNPPTYAGADTSGYRDPDIVEMIQDTTQALIDSGEDPAQAPTRAVELVAPLLARDLDIRPHRGDYNRVGDTTLDTWGAYLQGNWSLGPVSFTSITGYDTYDRFRETDQDFTPNIVFEAVSEDSARQFFQELRLDGELADVPFSWEAGGYYLGEQLDSTTTQFFQGGADVAVLDFTQDLDSFAFYGAFSWDFLDDFTLEGGARYNYDRKTFDFQLTRPGAAPATKPTEVWTAPTGTIALTYRFREDVSAYWKYSRGWKPGTFNSSATITVENVVAADPENLDAWEAGLRGRWLEGRLAAGLAFFYYGYEDYQVFILEDEPLSPPTLQIVNANNAEVYGAEFDMRAEPLSGLVPEFMEGLVLTGRVGWLESQFLDFTNEVVRQIFGVGPVPVTLDFTGNPLINSPRFKASLAADWTFDLGRWGALIPRYDFAWTDDIFFDANEGRGQPDSTPQRLGTLRPEYAVGQPAFWLHNLRLTYRTPEGNIEVAGWVRNLTDEAYKTYAFDASTFAKLDVNFIGEPRTWGVDLTIRW
jgi:iron complex outermembrane receptor protein